MLDRLEQRLGLPPLKEMSDMMTDEKIKQLGALLAKLDKLSKDTSAIKDMVVLLQLIKELDQQGTLGRLDSLLKELGPITKGQTAAKLVEKLGKIEKTISALMKEP